MVFKVFIESFQRRAAGALFLLLVFSASRAFSAHDTLINPAAGAGGSYPQNPSEEYQVTERGYLINFSAFQYRESTGDNWVKAVVTIKDVETGNPYTGPLRVVFYNDSFFNSDEVLERPFEEPFENRYITYASFNVDGRFRVRVFFGDNNEDISVEFPLTVGSPGTGSYILLLAVTGVLAVVAFVAYRKRSREREAHVPAG